MVNNPQLADLIPETPEKIPLRQAIHIFLENKHQSIPVILELYKRMDAEPWMVLLGLSWEYQLKNHSQYTDELNQILVENKKYWHFLTKNELLGTWLDLPEEIIVYRGCRDYNRNSLCWAGSKLAAKYYVRPEMFPENECCPIVITAKAKSKNIASVRHVGNDSIIADTLPSTIKIKNYFKMPTHFEYIVVNPHEIEIINEEKVTVGECWSARMQGEIWNNFNLKPEIRY